MIGGPRFEILVHICTSYHTVQLIQLRHSHSVLRLIISLNRGPVDIEKIPA